MKRIVVVISLALSAACMGNPYAKFYTNMQRPETSSGAIPASGPLQIFGGAELPESIDELYRRGYVIVGQSAFNAALGDPKESQLRDQAARVGAHIVLVSSKYTSTISGALPLSLPTTTTTTTATTGSVGGIPIASRSTSSTSGSSVVSIPYSVDRGDFLALYFIRVSPRLGIYVGPVDAATRQRLETNAGVLIRIVVEGSPAFGADILPGDILMAINESRVGSVEHFQELVRSHAGESVVLDLDRKGRSVRKTVTLRR